MSRVGSDACVGAELAEDRVADPPLQRATSFLGRLRIDVDLALVVGPPGGAVADLGDRGHVQGVVELSVASRVETVPHDLARRRLDGGGAVVGGEVPRGREAGDVTGVPDQQRGNDRSDAVDLGHGGAGRGDRGRGALLDLGDVLVESSDVRDKLEGGLLADLLHRRGWVDRAEPRCCTVSGDPPSDPARGKRCDERVQPTYGLGSQRGEVLVTVGEQPEHHRVVLDHHRAQVRVPQRGDRGRERIVRVILRSAPGPQ